MEDEKIVSLYWDRDESAIRETEEKYDRYLTKIAYNILNNPEDSRESVNDTYLAAWNSMPPHRPSVLSAYLAKLTRRISIDLFRYRTREKRLPSEYALSLSELGDSVSGGNTTEEAVNASLLAEAIAAYLRTLPEQTRSAFLGRYYFLDSVKEVAGLEIPIVPDPTLLIDPEQWQAVPGEPLVKDPYIFYYSWAYEDEELHRIVQEYAQKRGLEVYVIDAFKWPKLKPQNYGFRMAPSGGPQTFLNLMKYAEFAFVQSFHGVIFAYMMGRDFCLLDNRPVGAMDNRLAAILKLLNVEDRVARRVEDITEDHIDYSAIPETLAKSRETGFGYLEDALGVTVSL